jgi:hypothetical protein
MENSNLADRYFYAKRRLEEAEADVEVIRQEILKTGVAAITGQEARVTVSETEFKRFNSAKAKEFLTPQQVKACTTVSEGHIVRVKPLGKAKAARPLFDD